MSSPSVLSSTTQEHGFPGLSSLSTYDFSLLLYLSLLDALFLPLQSRIDGGGELRSKLSEHLKHAKTRGLDRLELGTGRDFPVDPHWEAEEGNEG